jgi:hypothetical protein
MHRIISLSSIQICLNVCSEIVCSDTTFPQGTNVFFHQIFFFTNFRWILHLKENT